MLAEISGLFHFLNAYPVLNTDFGADFVTVAYKNEFCLNSSVGGYHSLYVLKPEIPWMLLHK